MHVSDPQDLSGGELQRFAIATVCIQRANVYMFDEPSSYLDVKQRLNAARAIRELRQADKCVSNTIVYVYLALLLYRAGTVFACP